ncbi:MAG TPA: hypothetical protein VE993_05960 [Stellaceae bacterium]|nr:hypothetical protein [Stellaceae bacterium]
MADQMIREAVAAFSDPARLQSAADELLVRGFDRSFLSVMPPNRDIERRFGPNWRVEQVMDDPATPRVGFVGPDSRAEGRGLAAGGLGYLGACIAAGATIATGGVLPLVIAVAAAAGAGGGALGTALGRSWNARYTEWLQQQQRRGGIPLWVRTADAEAEKRACEVLTRRGGDKVHIVELPYRAPRRRRGVSGQLAWVDKPVGEALGR